MGIEKKAALICVVVLAVLFGIGLSNREERSDQARSVPAKSVESWHRKVLKDLSEHAESSDQEGPDLDRPSPADTPPVTERDEVDRPADEPGQENEATTASRTVVVRPGDTFSSIAARELGGARFFRVLMKANPHLNPRRLRIGSKVVVPGTAQLTRSNRKPSAPGGAGLYRVHNNETLSGIAQKKYGRASRWKDILAANRDKFRRPRDLRAGMVIRLP